MNKKTFFWLFSLFLLVLTLAAGVSGVELVPLSTFQYGFNDNLVDTGSGAYNLSFFGAGAYSSVDPKLGNASLYSNEDGGARLAAPVGLSTGDTSFTLAAWIKPETQPVGENDVYVLLGDINAANGAVPLIYGQNSGSYKVQIGSNAEYTLPGALTDWTHVVWTYQAGTKSTKLYVNGSNVFNVTRTSAFNLVYTTGGIYVGADNNQANDMDGGIDDVRYYDGTILNLTQVLALYNQGAGTQDNPVNEAGPDNLTITVTDSWDDSAVNNVTAALLGVTFTNTTGSIIYTNITQNDSLLVDINLTGEDYFSRSFISQNISSNLALELFQSEISFETLELVTNDSLSGVTYTINGQVSSIFNLSAGSYNVTASKAGYYPLNYSFNVSPLDNLTLTVMGLYNSLVFLNLTDVVTEDLIEVSSYVSLSHSGGYQAVFSSSNGSLSFPSIQDLFELVLWADRYAFRYENVTFNTTVQHLSYDLYANNSVWITARDFDTGVALTNFTVQIYNTEFNFEGSDNNTGTAMIEDIDSGVYSVRVNKNGYSVAEYPVTVTGGSHQNIVAYLVSGGTSTIFTVRDIISGSIIEGAQASMYKIIGGEWTLVSSQDTDITGRVQFTFIDNTEYKFIIAVDGYEEKTFFLQPIYDTYTVRMTPTTESVPDLVTGSWFYSINNSGQFFNNMNNSFSISITSGMGTLEYYYLNVTAPNGSLYQATCAVAAGCSDDFILEITGAAFNETVVVDYAVKETGRSLKNFRVIYVVQGTYDPNTLDGWGEEDEVGDLEKTVTVVTICLVVVGVISTGSVMLGINPVMPAGVALGVLIEIMAYVDFVAGPVAHLIALGCLLIIWFGRGEL